MHAPPPINICHTQMIIMVYSKTTSQLANAESMRIPSSHALGSISKQRSTKAQMLAYLPVEHLWQMPHLRRCSTAACPPSQCSTQKWVAQLVPSQFSVSLASWPAHPPMSHCNMQGSVHVICTWHHIHTLSPFTDRDAAACYLV